MEAWLLVLMVNNEALDAVQWRGPILGLAEGKQSWRVFQAMAAKEVVLILVSIKYLSFWDG